MNKVEGIRGLSLGIIRKGNKILVSPGYDKSKGESFYRPLGGGIEFGETSEEALKREFMEEISAELKDCRLITVVENIFTYEERKGHEICFILRRAWRTRVYMRKKNSKF
ncbi:MAG: NUDIX hydrolase [Bacillota bacterium]